MPSPKGPKNKVAWTRSLTERFIFVNKHVTFFIACTFTSFVLKTTVRCKYCCNYLYKQKVEEEKDKLVNFFQFGKEKKLFTSLNLHFFPVCFFS